MSTLAAQTNNRDKLGQSSDSRRLDESRLGHSAAGLGQVLGSLSTMTMTQVRSNRNHSDRGRESHNINAQSQMQQTVCGLLSNRCM